VNHCKLFVLRVGVALSIGAILVDWYSKLFVTVKWNGCLSNWFPARNTTHQGSVISPNLFTVFMNIFILNIRNHDLGCYVTRSLFSCILDVLQDTLHIVHLTYSDLLLKFTVDKSYGIAFGPNAANLLPCLLAVKPSIGVVQLSICVFT